MVHRPADALAARAEQHPSRPCRAVSLLSPMHATEVPLLTHRAYTHSFAFALADRERVGFDHVKRLVLAAIHIPVDIVRAVEHATHSAPIVVIARERPSGGQSAASSLPQRLGRQDPLLPLRDGVEDHLELGPRLLLDARAGRGRSRPGAWRSARASGASRRGGLQPKDRPPLQALGPARGRRRRCRPPGAPGRGASSATQGRVMSVRPPSPADYPGESTKG